MMAIDLSAQLAWFPIALDALLIASAAAVAAAAWSAQRRASRVPSSTRVPATVTAIVGRSPSVPATAGQTPSATSFPEAA